MILIEQKWVLIQRGLAHSMSSVLQTYLRGMSVPLVVFGAAKFTGADVSFTSPGAQIEEKCSDLSEADGASHVCIIGTIK